MFRKTYILPLILLIGFSLCLINGFADENKNGELLEEINSADGFILEGVFEFPTAEGPAYIQGTPEFQKVRDRIIGTRDFEKMRDLPRDSQDYQLGTKVGWFIVPQRFDPNRIWVCTGFLVGPDLFMTNHHCIHDDFGTLPLENAAIYMDYYQDLNVDPTAGGVTAGVSEILQADALKDYALLRLDKPIGDTYGWLELDTTTRVDSTQSVKLISHPRGRSKEIVRRNSQIVDIPIGHPLLREPFALAYLADSEGGSSGSPVFLREGTGVIAIHHSAWTRGGVPQFNAGSLMSYIVPEIQRWLPGGTPPPPTPPPTLTGNLMYWSDTGADKIQRANLNGTNVQDLVITVNASGIALDVQGGKMYWTNDFGAGKIQRANLDGSNIEDLVTGFEDLADIELDIAGGKMYWTDFGAGKIQRANLNGSNVQNLITGLTSPNNIALDVAGGKMYWTDNNADKIQRANLDGSNVQNLITRDRGLRSPIGIALDVASGKMYWVDTGADKIQRANLDGSNVQDLITGLDHPNCITLDVAGGKMYWTELHAGKIQRANLDGSNIEDLITRGLNSPRDIALGISGPSPTDTPPTFGGATIATINATVGTAITPRILPAATDPDGDVITYALTPALPTGLTFNATTRLLSGTPTAPMAATIYTYTATSNGKTASLPFIIEVVADAPADDPLDVNGDGRVDVLDLVQVAIFYGKRGDNLPEDVNADGIVNVTDLVAVANGIDAADDLSLAVEELLLLALAEAAAVEAAAEAPMGFGRHQHALFLSLTYDNVSAALADARALGTGDVRLGKWVPMLEGLLQALAELGTIPEATALLPNYPNPFNPETWIPYHLTMDAEVTLTIYNMQGVIVRQLMLGHQPAGIYESRGRAAHWEGKNQIGEKVASGLYFYTLTAGDFTATRKLLIAK